jgi:hypothetical protein
MATFSTIKEKNKKEALTKISAQKKVEDAFFKSVSRLASQTSSSITEIKDKDLAKVKLNNVLGASRGIAPESHRIAADDFMIIRKLFGKPVVHCKPSAVEMEFLAKYDFNPIEFSTYKQIEDEIALLKKWSSSKNIEIQKAASIIINIRAKELKYLIATNYVSITNEIYGGYRALEKYFENISKYRVES